MDKLTIDRISKAHPKIRKELEELYLECNKKLPKGVRLRFSSVYRTPTEQTALFNQRPKVTNARAFQSIHNYGLAFDYVILRDRDNNGTFESIDWDIRNEYHLLVVNFFKSYGYEWGGDWRNFKDYPHFQKDFGYTWQTLKRKLEIGDIIEDANDIKYPHI